jgi:hypothetical protein
MRNYDPQTSTLEIVGLRPYLVGIRQKAVKRLNLGCHNQARPTLGGDGSGKHVSGTT